MGTLEKLAKNSKNWATKYMDIDLKVIGKTIIHPFMWVRKGVEL